MSQEALQEGAKEPSSPSKKGKEKVVSIVANNSAAHPVKQKNQHLLLFTPDPPEINSVRYN